MKLLRVKIEDEPIAEYVEGTKILKRLRTGTCTFRGIEGDMSFTLLEEDIEAVSEALMYKCNKLAQEV